MAQTTINERLKFLIESLGISARAFSAAIGSGDTNTRNYLDRGSKPGADYLEKIVRRFEHVNSVWLLTGVGDPFTGTAPQTIEPLVSYTKNNYGAKASNTKGPVHQQVGTGQSADTEKLQAELVLARQEIESLKIQLTMKDQLLAAKDETLGVFRAASRNPN